MANKENEPSPREHVLDMGKDEDTGEQAWRRALEELEKTSGSGGTAQPKISPPPAPAPRRSTNVGHKLGRKMASTMMHEALTKIEESHEALTQFIARHPYLIAPNVHRLMEEHLRETIVTMSRERDRRLPPGGGPDA